MKGGYLARLFSFMLNTMSEIPTTEPTEFIAGDTVQWTKTLDDYTADAYALTYILQPIAGGTPITVAATADGTDHSITISAATSADYTAGDYKWFSRVADIATGLIKYSIGSGFLTILPDPAAFTTSSDLRTHAETMLDAIEATLEGRASNDQLKLTIADKSIEKHTWQELLAVRKIYRAEVKAEHASAQQADGKTTGGRYLMEL